MAEARVHYEEHYTGQTPWSDVRDLESLGVNMRLHVYVTDLVQAPGAGIPFRWDASGPERRAADR